MTLPLLQGLNPAQQQAVQVVDGPTLVLAGPGSGKTGVLTRRVAFLIEQAGIDPFNILAVTFTNKAAREMKERIEGLIGDGRAAAVTAGTFHSICVRILRREIQHLGRERDFAIYDSDDQQRVMKRVLKELNLDEKKFPPRAIHGTISAAKNEFIDVQEYAKHARSYYDEVVARCFARYQALLRESNALDFDDLLVETVRLFEQHPTVLERYQDRYRYVLADEYQDTNRVQYLLLKQLAARYRNLFVVGDEDQCVPAGELVQTERGPQPIEQIATGQRVLAGAGRGTVVPALVEKTRSRPYQGKLVQATTAAGRVLRVTPNHMCFARLAPGMDVYYVYLMFRRDKGFRVGLTRGYRSEGQRYGIVNGLDVRMRQERADKAWILRACASRAEAVYYEQFFAIAYGIPTMIFDVAGRGDLSITQEQIDQLYQAIDTRSNAERLMTELMLFEDYPHCQPYGSSGSAMPDRLLVHMTAFGGHEPSQESPWFRHRVWLNTTSRVVEQQVIEQGITTRAGQRETWRVERVYKHMSQTAAFAEEMARATGLSIARWAKLSANGKFAFQPASHLRPSMLLPVLEDGRVIDDPIVSVEFVDYEGMVYDLDVENVHNYSVGDVLVHNSVYAFRGADIRNIRYFENDYPDAVVIMLEQNYRSTQAILDVAQAVINRSGKRVRKKQLWTQNDKGTLVVVQEGNDQDEEAQLVASEAARLVASGEFRLGEIAVMYRTNAQSRAVEEALISRGLQYIIVGGTRFYERKEVKDTLAYVRLALNPFDSVSFSRVMNWPARGIGQRTEDELNRWAARLGVPLYAALQVLADESPATAGEAASPFSGRTKTALLAFLSLVDELITAREQCTLAELLDLVFARVGVEQALIREYGEEEGRERWGNVVELQNVATSYVNMPRESQLPTFLEEVALVADVDQVDEERNALTCITLHQAKGLEYPVVFLVGLEEGLLPHSRSLDDAEALDEERRLFYVGATRAKQRLYMMYAFRRTSYGRTNISQPSRFLADIPREMTHQMPKRGYADFNQSSMFSQRSSFNTPSRAMPSRPNPGRANQPSTAPNSRRATPTGAPKPSESSFFAGQKVRHASFGDGVVVSSKLVDGDEEVTVAFSGKGVKRLLASFARLEKVE